jgi:hypothetical protein
MEAISLDTLEKYTQPFRDCIYSHFIIGQERVAPSAEHLDQIWCLNKSGAKFLWEFDMNVNHKVLAHYPDVARYFKSIAEFRLGEGGLKKWLFDCAVPFDQKVYLAVQPDMGFILTWKMVIKYSENIFFAHDLGIWDRSMDWILTYHHDELWQFGRHRLSSSNE